MERILTTRPNKIAECIVSTEWKTIIVIVVIKQRNQTKTTQGGQPFSILVDQHCFGRDSTKLTATVDKRSAFRVKAKYSAVFSHGTVLNFPSDYLQD